MSGLKFDRLLPRTLPREPYSLGIGYRRLGGVDGGAAMRAPATLGLLWVIATTNWVAGRYLDPQGRPISSSRLFTWFVATGGAVAVYAIGLAQRRLSDQLRAATLELAERDTLTGLHNRVGFARESPRLVGVARREGEAIWLAFLDVDRFKSVNDLLGHDAGDLVLAPGVTVEVAEAAPGGPDSTAEVLKALIVEADSKMYERRHTEGRPIR